MTRSANAFLRTVIAVAVVLGAPRSAQALSPYLPLQLAPELEALVERMLVLGDEPVLTRPLRVDAVLRALERGCERDPTACRRVRSHLERHAATLALDHASAEVALSRDGSTLAANRQGAPSDSHHHLGVGAHWRPLPYVLFTGGGVAYQDVVRPDGSYLSVGLESVRLDAGYRPHWLSPMQDSAMLWSSNASAIPSLTLSNDRPLTALGLSYELFAGLMSDSDHIAWKGGYTSGRPAIAGTHLSVRPVPWLALGASRTIQFGGGARGGRSLLAFARAFVNPSGNDNTHDGLDSDQEFGNQLASVSARLTLPGPLPVALYGEFAGEDTSHYSNWRLGNAALSLGLYLPALPLGSDATYEYSGWQNGWYAHHVYGDGYVNDGAPAGHWFANLDGGEAVGGSAHTLSINTLLGEGGLLTLRARLIRFASYAARATGTGWELSARCGRALGAGLAGLEVGGGRTPLGEAQATARLYLRW